MPDKPLSGSPQTTGVLAVTNEPCIKDNNGRSSSTRNGSDILTAKSPFFPLSCATMPSQYALLYCSPVKDDHKTASLLFCCCGCVCISVLSMCLCVLSAISAYVCLVCSVYWLSECLVCA